MHTVELLDEALKVGEILGFRVRQEWLGGSGGGGCEISGQKWLFVDLALNAPDQLEQVVQAIRGCPQAATMSMHPQLRRMLNFRHAA